MQFQSITYAGHSAIFIEGENFTAAIDPWLDNPLCPPQLKNPKRLDLIICSHGHSDHTGGVPELAKKTGAKVTANFELGNLLVQAGVPEKQLLPMNKGGSITHAGIKISLVQAIHSSSYDTPDGAVYAGEPCGVVVNDGKNVIYHAGDTSIFSDMKLLGELHKPTIALLPIGDCFTMGPAEAARAAQMIGAPVVIPIHYATFPLLTGTAEQFSEACSGLPVKVRALKPGETHRL